MSTEAALREIAARYVWWQPPEVTLARRHHFLCQVMALGTEEDVTTVRRAMGDPALLDALEHAPPGVMDPKSWNFWHLFFGRRPPPLPERPLP
ncbi:hypothetical protein [Sorangium sp. So ce117]|uniref:hypothetical protein n=1 Tax=Sorangium sp. So ce117 TaxID=3133277 RepID=UPI003F5ED573